MSELIYHMLLTLLTSKTHGNKSKDSFYRAWRFSGKFHVFKFFINGDPLIIPTTNNETGGAVAVVRSSRILSSSSPSPERSIPDIPVLRSNSTATLAMAEQSGDMSSWMEVAPALLLAPFPRCAGCPGLETIEEEGEEVEEEKGGDYSKAKGLEDETRTAMTAAKFRDLWSWVCFRGEAVDTSVNDGAKFDLHSCNDLCELLLFGNGSKCLDLLD